jgi:flavorubredoxin
MSDGEVFQTGSKRYRFVHTPQVPHNWEAGMLFEETTGVLFSSDLFHQNGDVEATTESDRIGRTRETMHEIQASPLAHYFPYTARTDAEIQRIADLKPRVLATMHGSIFSGDGERAMRDYAGVLKEVFAS